MTLACSTAINRRERKKLEGKIPSLLSLQPLSISVCLYPLPPLPEALVKVMEDGERGGREPAETTETQNGREGDRERDRNKTQSHIASSIQHFVVAVLPFFIFLFRDVSEPVKPKQFLLGGGIAS